MKAIEGSIGRVFLVRLEEGDVLPGCIEEFATENNIKHGHVVVIGGIGRGNIIVGPRRSDEKPPEPMVLPIDGAHEIVASGIIAPSNDGKPVLHIHGALGRSGKTTTGCLRKNVEVWTVGEAVIYEIIGVSSKRVYDEKTGFTLLDVDKK